MRMPESCYHCGRIIKQVRKRKGRYWHVDEGGCGKQLRKEGVEKNIPKELIEK